MSNLIYVHYQNRSSYMSYYQNRSYVIPISTDFFMCLTFMSNLYQQISYMSHYHVYHTYINEYSLCLLIRIISMSYLYQRIFHVSPRQNDIYVQPISTNFTHVSLSCMSFLCTTYINKFYICLITRIIVMLYLYQRIFYVSPCQNDIYVQPISTNFIHISVSCMYPHPHHIYVQPISTNSIYVSLSEL